ncbi:MAG: MBL fold metallo-hydrolase [Gammaproteobacteria bacterium]|nr:MBL fold metallo-hydrolase [Gammaproteobacteria bacterium]
MSIRKYYQYESVKGLKVGRINLGINTQFILYRIHETVIDAGPCNQWRYIRKFLSQSAVKQLLLTHHHEDHAGNAQRIAQHYHITPKAPELSQAKLARGYSTPILQKIIWGNPKPVETETLCDIEYLDDGTKIIPIATPGHSKDLTCLYLPEKGYLFSGDLFIARTVKIMRSDENLLQMITSLENVLRLDFKTLFCSHAGIIENGKQILQEKLDRIIALCARVQELSKRGLNIDEISFQLLGPEDRIAKLTRGNLSRLNVIKQCILVNSCEHTQSGFNID